MPLFKQNIKEYIDILTILVSKHCQLSEISILFDSMSDLY